MTNHEPSQASHLELPSSALHARSRREPHIDSEEAVQYERRRVSRELEPLHNFESLRHSSEAEAGPSYADTHLRSRNAAAQESREHLKRAASNASTQQDVPGASEAGGRSVRSSQRAPRWDNALSRFWTRHVSITIEEGAHRDHLALERTFLGYLRTSLLLVMTGVLIAQLFRLQRTSNPNPTFGFYVIGLPLSMTFIGMAILVLLVGAFRFWKLQNGLVRGKAHSGGWEVLLVMGLSALLLLATFGLVLGVNIEKSLDGD